MTQLQGLQPFLIHSAWLQSLVNFLQLPYCHGLFIKLRASHPGDIRESENIVIWFPEKILFSLTVGLGASAKKKLPTLYPFTSDSLSRAFTWSQFRMILESDEFHMMFPGGWLGAIKKLRYTKSQIIKSQWILRNISLLEFKSGGNLMGYCTNMCLQGH